MLLVVLFLPPVIFWIFSGIFGDFHSIGRIFRDFETIFRDFQAFSNIFHGVSGMLQVKDLQGFLMNCQGISGIFVAQLTLERRIMRGPDFVDELFVPSFGSRTSACGSKLPQDVATRGMFMSRVSADAGVPADLPARL